MKNILLLLAFISPSILCLSQTVGTISWNEESQDAYTLIVPTGYVSSYLVDNCGREINSWSHQHIAGLVGYLLEDGSLMRASRLSSDVFQGGGIGGLIERYSWDGELIWEYSLANDFYHLHHDFEVLPNGNILTVAWEWHSEDDAVAIGRDPSTLTGEIWTTIIQEIEPTGNSGGNVVWEWKFWDHLAQDFDSNQGNFTVLSEHPELLDINFAPLDGGIFMGPADWIHVNAIDYNQELDQIAFSSRHLSELYIIDHSTTTEEAASHQGGNSGMGGDILYRWGNPMSYDRGTIEDSKLWGPHDIHWIEDGFNDGGKLMIFNNGEGRPEGNYSTVEIINPPIQEDGSYDITDANPFDPTSADWTFQANPTEDLYSARVAGAQRLENGNTLICEGTKGRVIEIDSDNEIVWEYINPVGQTGPVAQGNNPTNNDLFRAYKYPLDYPAFDNVDVTPGAQLEFNPIDILCEPVSINEYENFIAQVYPNPSNGIFIIDLAQQEKVNLEVYDIHGKRIMNSIVNDQRHEIDLSEFSVGLYFVHLHHLKLDTHQSFKIIIE